jgi:topoisomerase-4 subunit A
MVLAICQSGKYITTNYDLANHYEPDVIYVGKYDPKKIFNAVYFNAEQGFVYLKRFTFEPATTPQSFIGDDENSYLIDITETEKPFIEIIFGGDDGNKTPKILNADEFIAVKSISARGKRLTQYVVEKAKFITPETDLEEIGKTQEQTNDQENKQTTDGTITFEVTMPDGKKIDLSGE